LRRISGIGKAKVERYGEAILALLHADRVGSDPATTAEPTTVDEGTEPTTAPTSLTNTDDAPAEATPA